MNIQSGDGQALVVEMESFFRRQGIVSENGSKEDGTEPTVDETYVWNVYAALRDYESASQGVVTRVKEIMTSGGLEK